MTHKRNTEGIKQLAREKRQEAFKKTERGIKELIKAREPVTFTSVAQRAGVSTSWLYQQPELVEKIKQLRQTTQGKTYIAPKQRASDASKEAIIATLRNEIKKIREDNKSLKKELEDAYSLIYGVYEEENNRLKRELEQFKKDLEQYRSRESQGTTKQSRISDKVQAKLNRLGIKCNTTLQRIIKVADEQRILDAIVALEAQMETGIVKNPGGFLFKAITDGWEKEAPPEQQQRQPEIYTALPESDEELVPLDQLKQLGSVFRLSDD